MAFLALDNRSINNTQQPNFVIKNKLLAVFGYY